MLMSAMSFTLSDNSCFWSSMSSFSRDCIKEKIFCQAVCSGHVSQQSSAWCNLLQNPFVRTFVHPAYRKKSTVAFQKKQFSSCQLSSRPKILLRMLLFGMSMLADVVSWYAMKWTCLSRCCLAKSLLYLPLQYVILLLWYLLLHL